MIGYENYRRFWEPSASSGGLFAGLILIVLIIRGYTLPLISALVDYVVRCVPLPGKGAFYFAVSALACVILFPAAAVVPALVALAVLDGVATIAGIRFGRTRIFNGKSVEGAAAGMAVTFPVLLLVLPVVGALVVAVIAGLIEMFSPVDDNLVIPIGICVLLTPFRHSSEKSVPGYRHVYLRDTSAYQRIVSPDKDGRTIRIPVRLSRGRHILRDAS